MNALQKFRFRLSRFEYWPFDLFYLPVYFYYLILVVKNRSFAFFTTSNPSFENSGFLGGSKWEIYQIIPNRYLPITIKVSAKTHHQDLIKTLSRTGINFPFIAKPDIGERGWMVQKIKNEKDLTTYLQKIQVDFIIQELVEYPVELGVFYVRLPNDSKGRVTSLVRKEFLSVTGDGKTRVKDLLKTNKRAQINFDFSSRFTLELLDTIPEKGKRVIVETIGNHCRGTTFLNANNEIDEKLNETIDFVAKEIPGFYYGRFDLRCASIQDLKRGQNFKILELNGAGSEPSHIYHPGYSLVKAYRDIIWHFNTLSIISQQNRQLGHKPLSLIEGLKKWGEIRRYNRLKQ